MTCNACHEAQTHAASHVFNANCLRCSERHFAHLPMVWESQQAGRITSAYQAALNKQFGEEGAAAAHGSVKAWVVRIKQARGTK